MKTLKKFIQRQIYILRRVLEFMRGEIITMKVTEGTATLMRNGMVIIRSGGSTDGIPLWLCSSDLQARFANEIIQRDKQNE
jgi:hypothetical protein